MALFLKPHGDGGVAYGASVLLLFANIVLGGATRTGYLADVLLQFLSLPFLTLAAWLWLDRLTVPPGRLRLSLGLACGAATAVVGVLIALAQVFPLFGAPGWGGISARLLAAGGQGLEGVAWTGSSSVDPAASLAALPAVLPPLALFLLVALLDEERRLRFSGWALVFGFLALFLGILQVMQGPASALRFFEISNRSESVGFFANRNHFAAQLYVTFLIGVAWLVGRGDGVLGHRGPSASKVIWLAGAFCLGLLIMAGIALARSRAGILLLLLGLAGVVIMAPLILAVLRGRAAPPRRVRSLVLAVLVGLVLLVGQLGADRFLGRFGGGLVDQMRASLNETTLQAALEALPFGTGLGTFTAVFPVYEGAATLGPQYVNRAHDDWVEFFLETGLAGGLLVALFLVWFGARLYRLWIAPEESEATRLVVLQQCASLAVLLLLLHSFVDYPLRTATMLAYFAACCALMTPAARGMAGEGSTLAPAPRDRAGRPPSPSPQLGERRRRGTPSSARLAPGGRLLRERV